MKIYSCFFVFLIFALPCAAQSSQEKEVQESVKQFFAALSARDSLAMKRWATTDLTLIEYGTVWNMDTLIRRGIRQNTDMNFKRDDRFDFLSTDVIGKMALVNYRLSSSITRNGSHMNVQWIETVTLVNEENRWKVKFLHSTLLNRNKP